MRGMLACPSLTVFLPPPSSYNAAFLPFRKSSESTAPARIGICSVMVQLLTITIKCPFFMAKGKRKEQVSPYLGVARQVEKQVQPQL